MPFDKSIEHLADTPYTISYIIRKRQQVDNFNEYPKDKRPTERLIWEGSPEEINEFFDRVHGKEKDSSDQVIKFNIGEVEE